MLVLGGRTNTVGENVQLEVYETESSEWRKFNSLQRFRHSVWAIDATIFMHGGFENETPNIPTNSIMKLDLLELFSKVPQLVTKLENTVGNKRARSASSNSQNANNGEWQGNDTTRSGTPPM
jgi:hypothetical protein